MKKTFRRFLLLATLAGLAVASSSVVQADSLKRRLEAHLFRPEQLMEHSHALELNENQRRVISQAIGETEGAVTELQWKLKDASQELIDAVALEKPNEATVLAKAEQVLRFENEIKMRHLTLLIRIKETLTQEQQEKLRSSIQDR